MREVTGGGVGACVCGENTLLDSSIKRVIKGRDPGFKGLLWDGNPLPSNLRSNILYIMGSFYLIIKPSLSKLLYRTITPAPL